MAEAMVEETVAPEGDGGLGKANPGLHGLIQPDWPGVRLDDIDRRLLLLLDGDATRSQRSLACELGISAPTVRERLARLNERHVIEGRHIRVNWSAIGYPLLVIMPITLEQDAHADLVAGELIAIPELVELLLLSGPYDMLARFQVRSYRHLQSLLLDKVWPLPGLHRAETMISLGTLVQRDPLEVAFASDGVCDGGAGD